MKRRLFVSSAVMAGLSGKLTEAFAATNLLTRHPTITAFGSSGGIPSAYYTSVGGVYKYKHSSTTGASTELKLTEYGIPTLESTSRIRYRNYNGMAALEEFDPNTGAPAYPNLPPQCVAFVKGMTGNLGPTSTWYPGSALAPNQTTWTASAMTGTVMAYFGSDNPATGTSYDTNRQKGLAVHVLCIIQVNLDSTGKVISAVVVDQNFQTSGSISKWTIPYSGGAGRGYLKNYRIVMI